jgi:hypothetical protein
LLFHFSPPEVLPDNYIRGIFSLEILGSIVPESQEVSVPLYCSSGTLSANALPISRRLSVDCTMGIRWLAFCSPKVLATTMRILAFAIILYFLFWYFLFLFQAIPHKSS